MPTSAAVRRALVLPALLLATVSARADTVLFDDALNDGFDDWSWAERDLTQSAVVHAGSAAIAWQPDEFRGLFFHRADGIDLGTTEALTGWVRGAAPAGQVVHVCLTVGGTAVGCKPLSDFLPGNAIGTGWQAFTVPLAALVGAPFQTDGLWFQDQSGGDQPTLYLDDLVLVETEPPPPGPVTVTVDPALDRRPVDPRIHGTNFADADDLARVPYTMNRWGGNTTSRYNWRFDVDNRGADYYFQRIVSGDGVNLPAGSTANAFLDTTRAAGALPLLTVPIIGWIADDVRTKSWSYSVAKYGAQLRDECFEPGSASYCSTDSGNGRCDPAVNTTGFCSADGLILNDPADVNKPNTTQNARDWVAHLMTRYGPAGAGGIRHYALDNEPMLWHDTHRDVHPEPAGYDEVWQRNRDYGLAIKAEDPGAVVHGPVLWGWCAYFNSAQDSAGNGGLCGPLVSGPDRDAHGGTPFLAWYLEQVCGEAEANGVRPIDVLDVHYYPQGDGVSGLGPGETESPAVQARRLRALKELYDPAWNAEAWIGQPVRLIPRLRELVDTHCPGLEIALTEYRWGPDDSESAGLAQAEALAIFGREGLDMAMRWTTPAAGSPTETAFRFHLNYDGSGARVAGDSVRAVSSDVDAVGAYAVDEPGEALRVLLFNKDVQARTVNLALAAPRPGAWNLYRFGAGTPLGLTATGTIPGATLELTLPARTANLLVLPADDGAPLLVDGFEGPP